MTPPSDSVDVSDDVLEKIRERTLKIEKEHLHQKEARGIVPKIENMIEEEIADS
jgi:hypothetical protein